MKRLKNQDGSAILWAILLTTILTVLITSVLTLALQYYNATLSSVKNQQAYFTARSAAEIISKELSSNGGSSSLMPSAVGEANSKTVSSFGFDNTMGTASAVITKMDNATVKAKITAKYADQSYVMNATIVKQPMYFRGLAFKTLTNTTGQPLKITGDTDVYIDSAFEGNIQVGGNLIVNGNITFGDNSKVHGVDVSNQKFNAVANDGIPKSQIINAENYILSNYQLDVSFPAIRNSTISQMISFIRGKSKTEWCDTYWDTSDFSFLAGAFPDMEVNFELSTAARYLTVKQKDRIWPLRTYDCLWVSTIGYKNLNSKQVVPSAYILVDDNVQFNIKYSDNLLTNLYDILGAGKATVNIYLGENSTLTLGKPNFWVDTLVIGTLKSWGINLEPPKNFYLNIYGTPTSKLVLYDNVTVNGSINVGKIFLYGNNVTINYSTNNGIQVAKQQVGEMWQVAQYS